MGTLSGGQQNRVGQVRTGGIDPLGVYFRGAGRGAHHSEGQRWITEHCRDTDRSREKRSKREKWCVQRGETTNSPTVKITKRVKK